MNDILILKRVKNLLDEKPRELSVRNMSLFVRSLLDKRKLFISLAEEYGSPLYIIDTLFLRNRINYFKEIIRTHFSSFEIYYALKSNNMNEILTIITEESIGIDISSGIELEQALITGNKKIVFSGPGKTDDELRLAVSNSKSVTILIDSFSELERLDKITTEMDVTVKTGVRLSTNTYGLWRKFGIPPESLIDFMEKAALKKNILLEGIHFHTSWNMGPEPQQGFIKKLGIIFSELPSGLKKSIKFLDIGGGYWPEKGEWLRRKGTKEGALSDILFPENVNSIKGYYNKGTRIELYAEKIAETLKTSIPESVNWKICFEPGRWLVHSSVHLLMTVLDVKGKDIAITDAGTNAIGWERFEKDYFPVINISEPDIYEQKFNILGSLCTPEDVWGYSYHGKGISEGDILLIPDQGAYTYSLRQNFIKKLPEKVFIKENIQTVWPD